MIRFTVHGRPAAKGKSAPVSRKAMLMTGALYAGKTKGRICIAQSGSEKKKSSEKKAPKCRFPNFDS